jgi:hypothetical protein
MSYSPYEVQKKAHRAFLLDNYKYGILYWGRRTGKTLWSIQQVMWGAMLNQGQYHIVFKEYEAAQKVAWEQYLHLIPKELIAKTDKSTLTVFFNRFSGEVKFPWGIEAIVDDPSKPASTLRMLGSDKADSHRGLESNGMILDEYQEHDPYGWAAVYSKFFATTNGWACFMGTAKDRDSWNELLDFAQRDPQWYYSKATWRDAGKIDPAWVANDRKQAESRGELGIWLQEMELIPYSQQGAVYPKFSKEIHVIDPEKVPKEGTDYAVLDFGFAEGHPLAIGFVRITRDDVWYQWDEIHGTGIQLEDALSEMKYKLGDRMLTGIIADSARPDLIEWMGSRGYPVIPSPKKQNSVLTGIDLMRKRITPKIQMHGPPKPNYYITHNCKKTIYEWTHYRYKEIKEDRPPQELPEKRHDDMLDALRYLELFFKFGHPKNEKIPDSSMMKELYL